MIIEIFELNDKFPYLLSYCPDICYRYVKLRDYQK